MKNLTLVLGGTRSGKSAYAESLFEGAETPLYLATGSAGDGEMADRIARHRDRRGKHWKTLEEPIGLAAALLRESRPDQPILVDCLTLWLGNLMGSERDVAQSFDALTAILPRLNGPVVMVSNEVGWGIVPDNALARRFRDHAGALHQRVAAVAESVVLVAAGLPLILK
jgi:adenosylcobinamide kinase/adenosylcobinamide-phosphate guanylyltransferase